MRRSEKIPIFFLKNQIDESNRILPDIGFKVVSVLVDPLRRHVVGRSNEGVGDGCLRAEEPAQAEIADFHHALGCDEHVGRLDVCPEKNIVVIL